MSWQDVRNDIAQPSHWFWILISVAIALVATTGAYRQTFGFDRGNLLDTTVLRLQLPANRAELRAVADAPQAAMTWKIATYWQFVFIPAYVLLFAALLSRTDTAAGWFDARLIYIVIAAAADIAQTTSLIRCLDDIGRFHDTTRPSFTLVILFGAIKWLFIFLALRVLSLQYEQFVRWAWAGVLLRAFAAIGGWATPLAVAGLPARPIVGFAAWGILVVLVIKLVMQFLNLDQPGERILQNENEASGTSDVAV